MSSKRPDLCPNSQEELLQEVKTDGKPFTKRDECPYCVFPIGAHNKTAAASSVLAKRRLSLPTPISGNEWSQSTLRSFEINVMPTFTVAEVLNFGQLPSVSMKSSTSISASSSTSTSTSSSISSSPTRGQLLLQACEFIGTNRTLFDIPYKEAEFKARALPVPTDGVGWTCFKYLRLINGLIDSMGLESVVDDFVIHLLSFLGFNDGPLVILSKNTLKFSMNSPNKNVSAITDVTVFHIGHRFRFVVFEDKKREKDKQSDFEDAEAQLVAEAIAAVQYNMDEAAREAAKAKRHKSEADVSSPSAFVASSSTLTGDESPGCIFLVRVVGSSFSFYSAKLSSSLMGIIQDYSQAKTDLPSTIVHRLTIKIEMPSTVAGKKEVVLKDRFVFESNEDRKIIVEFLEGLREICLK